MVRTDFKVVLRFITPIIIYWPKFIKSHNKKGGSISSPKKPTNNKITSLFSKANTNIAQSTKNIKKNLASEFL